MWGRRRVKKHLFHETMALFLEKIAANRTKRSERHFIRLQGTLLENKLIVRYLMTQLGVARNGIINY